MHDEWEVIEEVAGALQAEVVRGFLEAQGVPTVLSQEGAGSVYAMTVGVLGRVQILVPPDQVEHARQILADYYAGAYEGMQFPAETQEQDELDEPDEAGEEAPLE
ncbi:MAG: DUF2007 domain-containing protein [Chloroflexota bacterium]